MSKKLFFVCPIGNEGSPERRTSDFVLDYIINPVAQNLDFKTHRSDLIVSQNTITEDIINHLQNDDLVIADVTGTNANVMFELGYRFSLKTPLILIAQSVDNLPFDISGLRVITYDTTLPDINKVKNDIKTRILTFNFSSEEPEKQEINEPKKQDSSYYSAKSENFKLDKYQSSLKPFTVDVSSPHVLDQHTSNLLDFTKSKDFKLTLDKYQSSLNPFDLSNFHNSDK